MKRNKTLGIIALVCVFALCMVALTACNDLAKPQITYKDGAFSWNAVEGASGYKVYVNDAKNEFDVSSTSVSASSENIAKNAVDNQENTLYVKAVKVDDSGKVEKESEVAEFKFDYKATKAAWTVTLNLNYTDAPAATTVSVDAGQKMDKPEDPTRTGYTFAGWYRDSYCMVEAVFSDGKIGITADTELFAKWTEQTEAGTVKVYFYHETWAQVYAKPSNGETALYEGDGVVMTAVQGKEHWYSAEINDTANSIVFTDGTDATESLTFNSATPYCKDGNWTATMPDDVEPQPTPDKGVFIKVNGGNPKELTLNAEAEAGKTEYMLTGVELAENDTVVITWDGVEVSNYAPKCGFDGTATIAGNYDFYVSAEQIWVVVPVGDDPTPTPNKVYIKVGDGEPVALKLNTGADEGKVEYMITGVEIAENETVVITWDGTAVSNYDPACKFNGTATVTGKYDFYVSEAKIWVVVPTTGGGGDPETMITVYFYNNGWVDNWAEPTMYCWNDAGNNAWPGQKMTSLGNGWFSLQVSSAYTKVIFVGANGNQTADLDLVASDGVAYYEYSGLTEKRPEA